LTTHRDLLEIADTLVTRGQTAIGQVEVAVRNMPRPLTLAEQVAGSLVLKMLASFEALVEDVRQGRGEAMHHLKTLCEAFIYFHEAATGEENAAIVLAYAHDERARRGKDQRHPDPALVADTSARRDALLRGAALPRYIRRVDQVAARHPNLPQWYASVYRRTCEPAHISDLEDFLPKQDVLPRSLSTPGVRRTYEAAHHGIAIMLSVLEYWNSVNDLGHSIEVQDLRRRFSVEP